MITEKQRQERKLGIGGSDMPILLGISSYKTPYQLYLEKIGETESKQDETSYQRWGNLLEDVIRHEFETIHDVKVQLPDTLVHPFHEFLRANIDGFINEWNAVLEVKCASSFTASEWGPAGSDVIPMTYLAQVAHYCMVTNASCAHIVVLIGGNDYREYKYERDTKLESQLLEKAREFWDCVQKRIPPKPVNEADLRLMFPVQEPEKTVQANNKIAEDLAILAETKLQIKELNEQEDKYKFNIMQYMEDAESLVDAIGMPLVSWKANKRGSRTFLMKGGN